MFLPLQRTGTFHSGRLKYKQIMFFFGLFHNKTLQNITWVVEYCQVIYMLFLLVPELNRTYFFGFAIAKAVLSSLQFNQHLFKVKHTLPKRNDYFVAGLAIVSVSSRRTKRIALPCLSDLLCLAISALLVGLGVAIRSALRFTASLF